MKTNLTPVRGTKDFLPNEMDVREKIISRITLAYEENGFQKIKTPILENLSLLSSSDSGDNQKLMFKTIKRGEKLDLTKTNLTEDDITEEGLRYDLTVPLVRFFSSNKDKLTSPFKSFQIDESFRAERPQKGRFRQFTQCDIDILGEKSITAEIEIIISIMSAFEKIGLQNITVKISDRRILASILAFCGFEKKDFENVSISLDKLDKIGFEGVKGELEEKGYDKTVVPKLVAILNTINVSGLDVLESYGCDKSIVNNIQTIISSVNDNTRDSYNAKFDISIIRGQGYYTGTVFEFYSEGSEFKNAIGGGGRYDNMVEKMVGTSIPAVGGSIGLEPVSIIVSSLRTLKRDRKRLALFYDEKSSIPHVIKQKKILIEKYDVSLFAQPKNLSFMLEKLKENNFSCFCSIRDNAIGEIKEL